MMSDKTLLLIISNTTNGLYLFRRDLIKELVRYVEVVIIASDTGRVDELQSIGCSVELMTIDLRGSNPLHELKLVKALKQRIKYINPDIVMTYTIKPNIYAGLVCTFLNIPFAANITGLGTAFEKGGLLRLFIKKIYKVGIEKAKVVFFENEANLDLFVEQGIVRREKTCLLAGAGVNLEYFVLQPYPINDTLGFLFIGRVMREKGIEELICAMRRLINEGKPCFLDVVGGFEEDYEGILKQCEAEGWMKYHGQQDDVRPFIKDADCFVLPSWHEGMANTNLECAASGRPIITSNIPGCKEAVIEGASGLLCKPKDANSLYEKMKLMMQMSREDREAMGKAGRKHMEAVFDKKKVVQATINALEA